MRKYVVLCVYLFIREDAQAECSSQKTKNVINVRSGEYRTLARSVRRALKIFKKTSEKIRVVFHDVPGGASLLNSREVGLWRNFFNVLAQNDILSQIDIQFHKQDHVREQSVFWSGIQKALLRSRSCQLLVRGGDFNFSDPENNIWREVLSVLNPQYAALCQCPGLIVKGALISQIENFESDVKESNASGAEGSLQRHHRQLISRFPGKILLKKSLVMAERLYDGDQPEKTFMGSMKKAIISQDITVEWDNDCPFLDTRSWSRTCVDKEKQVKWEDLLVTYVQAPLEHAQCYGVVSLTYRPLSKDFVLKNAL